MDDVRIWREYEQGMVKILPVAHMMVWRADERFVLTFAGISTQLTAVEQQAALKEADDTVEVVLRQSLRALGKEPTP